MTETREEATARRLRMAARARARAQRPGSNPWLSRAELLQVAAIWERWAAGKERPAAGIHT